MKKRDWLLLSFIFLRGMGFLSYRRAEGSFSNTTIKYVSFHNLLRQQIGKSVPGITALGILYKYLN